MKKLIIILGMVFMLTLVGCSNADVHNEVEVKTDEVIDETYIYETVIEETVIYETVIEEEILTEETTRYIEVVKPVGDGFYECRENGTTFEASKEYLQELEDNGGAVLDFGFGDYVPIG